MIWRAGCSSQALHFLHQEGQKCTFILDSCLCHRIEVGFVGRATTFSYHDKTILCTLCCFDINLRRQVTFGVNLIIHIERSILRIAQVVFSEGVVDAE